MIWDRYHCRFLHLIYRQTFFQTWLAPFLKQMIRVTIKVSTATFQESSKSAASSLSPKIRFALSTRSRRITCARTHHARTHARGIIAIDVFPGPRILRGWEQRNQRRFLTGENRDQWEICTAKRITDVFGPRRHNSGARKSSRGDFPIRIQRNRKFRATPPSVTA